MSRILHAIIDAIREDAPVEEVGIFLHATVVKSLQAGMAYTFPRASHDEPRDRGDIVANHGRLTEMSARQLAAYATSSHPMEASVGVAAINSLITVAPERAVRQKGVDLLLSWAAGKRLAVVGHFPFTERIRDQLKKLWVLELDPREGDLPASMAPEILPQADVVAITGATLINHTLEGLLALARGRQIIVMGPSTIISPVLFSLGVSALCGVQVTDPALAMGWLKEGGAFGGCPGWNRSPCSPAPRNPRKNQSKQADRNEPETFSPPCRYLRC